LLDIGVIGLRVRRFQPIEGRPVLGVIAAMIFSISVIATRGT
jgi:hypothetical protein